MESIQGAARPTPGIKSGPRGDPRLVRGVAARIIALLAGGASPRVLELGRGEDSLIEHLGDGNVRHLDVGKALTSLAEGASPILADPDSSFDYAVSLELLEEVPPEARDRLIAELRRVSRHGILVAVSAAEDEDADDIVAGVTATLAGRGDHLFTVDADWNTLSRLVTSAFGVANGAASDLEAILAALVSPAPEPPRKVLIVATTEDRSNVLPSSADQRGSGERDDRNVAATALSAIWGLGNELGERRRELRERDRELTEARAVLARKQAQIADISHRLGDALVAGTEERHARRRLEARIERIERTRTWHTVRVLQRVRARVLGFLAWPVRTVRGRGRGRGRG